MRLDIKFNPNDDNSSEEIFKQIDEYVKINDYNSSVAEISKVVYFDNLIGLEDPLESIFKKHNDLVFTLKKIFSNNIESEYNEFQPQLTYLLTFLISKGFIESNFLTKEKLEKVSNEQAREILLAFLASWDANKAIDLDKEFIVNNFQHIYNTNQFPINNLIIESEQYIKAILSALEDPKYHYSFNSEIQKVIRKGVEKELSSIEYLIRNVCLTDDDVIVEFACDLLEINLIRDFLEERWGNIVLERLYKDFSLIKNNLKDKSVKMTLNTLNDLKKKQKPQFAIAARYAINKLSDSDKKLIIQTVESVGNTPIENFDINFSILNNQSKDNWEWKDYANYFVQKYNNNGDGVIDIRDIAEDFKIKIFEHAFETSDFDGCLVRDNTLSLPIIIINTYKKSKGRINFTIAHELAHAIIPHHSKKIYFCNIDDMTKSNKFMMDKELEQEANNFAAYLLLPKKQFRDDVSKLNFTIENIKELSEKYDVSLVLVAKKWVEVSVLDIAMLFSTNGTIDWYEKGDNFPYWIDLDESIYTGSTVHEVISTDNLISTKKVNFSKWTKKEYPRHILLEESIRIFDKKALTLLQIIED